MQQKLRDHPYAETGFVLAIAMTLFFFGRMISGALYWHDPAHHNQTGKPWMTAG